MFELSLKKYTVIDVCVDRPIQIDVTLIVTCAVQYVFYNLWYEPWSRKCIKCFDSKVTNNVFF